MLNFLADLLAGFAVTLSVSKSPLFFMDEPECPKSLIK